MNILIITVYKDLLYGGGGATSSLALAGGLRKAGHQLRIVSREDFSQSFTIDSFFDLPVRNTFSANPFGKHDSELLSTIEEYNPDVVVLGAVDREILSFPTIRKINRPIILIFHDLYPVTGGCLFQGGVDITQVAEKYKFYDIYRCQKYQQGCNGCSLLMSSKYNSLPRLNHNLKKQTFLSRNDIVLAPVSNWMKQTLASVPYLQEHSSEVLYNIIDEKVFKSISMPSVIRKKYNLPVDKYLGLIIVHGLSTEPDRKGFFLVLEMLSKLQLSPKAIEFCAIGNAVSEPKTIYYHGFAIHFLGFIKDSELKAKIFSVSDFFICSALHENLPMVCLESLSCSTPVIAFGIGGISKDIIQHKHNGYLAKPFSTEEIATGIEWLCGLSDSERQDIKRNCRLYIEERFTDKAVVKQFEAIAELAKHNFLNRSFESHSKVSQEIRNLQLLSDYSKNRVQQPYYIPVQDRWYRFGQLSRQEKVWVIGKTVSKRAGLYKILKPLVRQLRQIWQK